MTKRNSKADYDIHHYKLADKRNNRALQWINLLQWRRTQTLSWELQCPGDTLSRDSSTTKALPDSSLQIKLCPHCNVLPIPCISLKNGTNMFVFLIYLEYLTPCSLVQSGDLFSTDADPIWEAAHWREKRNLHMFANVPFLPKNSGGRGIAERGFPAKKSLHMQAPYPSISPGEVYLACYKLRQNTFWHVFSEEAATNNPSNKQLSVPFLAECPLLNTSVKKRKSQSTIFVSATMNFSHPTI